jgi:hypothetical protein
MVFPPLFFKINGLGNICVNNKHCRYTAAAIASDATQIRMEIICKTPNKTLIRLFGARLPSPPGCQWCLSCHVTTSFFIKSSIFNIQYSIPALPGWGYLIFWILPFPECREVFSYANW